jgi:hypothetical protein
MVLIVKTQLRANFKAKSCHSTADTAGPLNSDKIQTRYFPNTSLECYSYIRLTECQKLLEYHIAIVGGSHVSDYEEYSLLACDTGRSLPKFHSTCYLLLAFASSLVLKMETVGSSKYW